MKIKPAEEKAIKQVLVGIDELLNPVKPKTLSELAAPSVPPPLPPIDFTDSEKARLSYLESPEYIPESEIKILEELSRVARDRVAQAKLHNLKLQQENCVHVFRYAGHSHNDDAYECKHCGIIRYE